MQLIIHNVATFKSIPLPVTSSFAVTAWIWNVATDSNNNPIPSPNDYMLLLSWHGTALDLIKKLWQYLKIPKDWDTGLVISIHKKDLKINVIL